VKVKVKDFVHKLVFHIRNVLFFLWLLHENNNSFHSVEVMYVH
jgi:hypothetical protein